MFINVQQCSVMFSNVPQGKSAKYGPLLGANVVFWFKRTKLGIKF